MMSEIYKVSHKPSFLLKQSHPLVVSHLPGVMFDSKLMVSESGFHIIRICLQKTGKYPRKDVYCVIFWPARHFSGLKLEGATVSQSVCCAVSPAE